MACNDGTSMVAASMSIQVLSTPVEQTYLNAMSPFRHLSPLTSVRRLLLDSQEILPSPADDILLTSSPPESIPPSPVISPENTKTLDPVKHRTMARSDKQLMASRRSAAIYGTNSCAVDFARSSSMADLKASSRTLKAEYSSDLRRVLPSVSDLRTLAHNQDTDARNTGLTQTNPTAAMPQQRRHVVSNLQDEHAYNEKKLRRKFHYKSYQDLHMLSLYQENISAESLRSFARTGPISNESNEPSSASTSDSGSSRTSSPAPKTPIDQRPEDETESAKMRRAHARQVQVIEQRQGSEFAEDEDHGEEEIIQMRTTVLDRPGKPKLIQIHRPRHSDQSLKQNIQDEIKIAASSPATPVRDQHEISSFSPYDTPTSGTPFTDLSRTAGEATPVPQKQPRLSIKTQFLIFQSPPSVAVRRLSADSTGTMFSTDERHRKTLADPFGSPLAHDPHTFARTSPPGLTRSSTTATRSISERSQHSHIYSQDTYDWRLDRAISLTTKAIEAHATRSFDLDSSVLGSFRTNRLNNDSDSLLMSKLNRVFSHSSHSSLSVLAAWLIVDQHYSRLFDSAPPKEPLSIDDQTFHELESSLAVPSCRTATIAQMPWTTTKIYRSQPRDTENMKNMPISSPLCSAQIPSKAALLLGIYTDPAGCKARPFAPATNSNPPSRSNSITVEDQARSVHASVQEVGRDLVRKLVVIPTSTSSPQSIAKQRGLKMMHMRGRSSATTTASTNVNQYDDAIESAARSLWEACRCVASTS